MIYHNYYFIERISSRLAEILVGAQLIECFSQNKDELIIAFELNHGGRFYIQANLEETTNLLYFPKEYARARKNSVNLFADTLGQRVLTIDQIPFDRSFKILFENKSFLLFQLYGRRSNIGLVNLNQSYTSFKSKFNREVNIEALSRNIDLLALTEETISSLEMTFDDDLKAHLDIQYQYTHLAIEEKRILLPDFINTLKTNPITIEDGIYPKISLLHSEGTETTDPLEICNGFYKIFTGDYLFKLKKQSHIRDLIKKRTHAQHYISKSKEKLKSLKDQRSIEEIANIIMANLHLIDPKKDHIELPDLYREGEVITLKLKSNISPQKNAEILYKKSKNQKQELTHIEDNIAAKMVLMEKIDKDILELGQSQSFKEIQNLIKSSPSTTQVTSLPFTTFHENNYTIYVGRNAKSNDLLTFHYGQKEDLWLHARDVAGSHVIIKKQDKKPIPSPVIERAAQLASYFSKRKTDTLCPVIYTERKYVRKPKGSPAGKVAVMKERVILVKPTL
ncbi:MAG: fibronectin/fibrinogen-binding protein [Flammeovirgaceae bacterium]|nr:fibronectin/fibrinogen-binding protein [Flammeovirgaceae bacterium]